VILEDCWVSALGNNKRKCAVYCEEIPNLLEIRNCNLAGAPPVLISEKIDPQTYFQARPGMLRFAFANNLGEFADQIPGMLRNPVLNEVVETEPGLSEEETRAALEKAVAEWLARPKEQEAPGEWKGHTQKTDPAEYQEISFDQYRWDLEDNMDGTSEKNAKYLAVAPAGDDVLLMRRISPRNNWPHVLIRDVKIDLDRFPFLTLQQKPTGAPAAFAVKAIDKESGVMLTLEETTHQSPTDVYRAYNLRDLFQLRGQRTFDLKFYYLATAWREGASPTPDNLLEAQPGEYTVLDFLRAEAE
jgi:hypothetical protein